MKKILRITMLVASMAVLAFACKEPVAPTPEPPVVITSPTEVPKITIDTTSYQTKEPFAILKDRGFEAYLVIKGLDKDNQVNGKISVADADKITELILSESSSIEQEKYSFIKKRYNLNEFLDVNYKRMLVISSIKDLKNLKNVRVFVGEPVRADSVVIDYENKIEDFYIRNVNFLNLDRCTNLTKLTVGGSQEGLFINLTKLKNLETLQGDNLVGLDFSQNINLKDLSLSTSKNISLDLTSLKGLLVLRILGNFDKVTNLPNSLVYVDIVKTQLQKFELENAAKLYQIRFLNNSKLVESNISGSKEIYHCISEGNAILGKILINKNQMIDSTTTASMSSGSVKLWQKDPWTKWVVKE